MDCSDESDELYCAYKDQECAEDEFKCPGNLKCIPQASVCNHIDDCKNGLGSDETFAEPANCAQISCSTNSFWALFFTMSICNDTSICIVDMALASYSSRTPCPRTLRSRILRTNKLKNLLYDLAFLHLRHFAPVKNSR